MLFVPSTAGLLACSVLRVFHCSKPIPTVVHRRFKFSTTQSCRMLEELRNSEIASETDPSVAKQYDTEKPKSDQWKDLYSIIDGQKVSILNTCRKSIGPVGRSMAIARRQGPNILTLPTNTAKNLMISLSTTKSKSPSRIQKHKIGPASPAQQPTLQMTILASKICITLRSVAWLGDLKDGVHDGTDKDPRIPTTEVKSKYIVYWKKEVTRLGFLREVSQAALTRWGRRTNRCSRRILRS